jgi:hypothetical protein
MKMPASDFGLISPCFQTLSCAEAGLKAAKLAAAMSAPSAKRREWLAVMKFLPESCCAAAAFLTFVPGDLSIIFMVGDIPKIPARD